MDVEPLRTVLDPAVLADRGRLPTAELRRLRAAAEIHEEGVSYTRRLLQGRLDILRAELLRRRESGDDGALDLLAALPRILGEDVGHAGPLQARATRLRMPPTADEHAHPVAALLDEGLVSRLPELGPEALQAVITDITVHERRLSELRRQLFEVIDHLRDELALRYKDGRADVRDLIAEP